VSFRSPPTSPAGASVLSIRPFRRLWIATSLSSLGDWLSLVALSTLASDLAGRGVAAQSAAVGGVWLTSLLPALLLGPLAGAVADRLDRRLNMIIGDVLRAALYLSLVLNLSLGFANELTNKRVVANLGLTYFLKAGGTHAIKLGGDFKLEAGYLASEASNPAAGSGFLNGNYAALAQLVYAPTFATIAFTYVNAYSDNGLNHGTGSTLSNLSGRAVASNSYGVEANFKLSKRLQVGGWVSYMDAEARTGATRGNGDVWSYAVTLAFPDLGKKGNLGGIIVGMEPKLTGTDALLSGLTRRSDQDTGLHIEAFYRHSVTENISITPGIIWLTSPNHNNGNDDIVVGVIRTTFSF